jgi:hypothetical protein
MERTNRTSSDWGTGSRYRDFSMMFSANRMWMVREYPGIRFERYADDGVPRTLREAAM